MAYEYLLKFWGGAEPYIKKELGIEETEHWFTTKAERDTFLEQLKPYQSYGLVWDEEEGEHVRLETIAKVRATYQGETYLFDVNFGYGYPVESAQYMLEEGNYSCDCNLSNFIREAYHLFPELECGEEIVIKFDVLQL